MPPLLDGLRILVLEDEVLIAMDVEELCREHGASEVTVVRSLAEMDQENPAVRFDAAIIDLMLGGVSTLGFAKHLDRQGVPFVFASGHSDIAEIGADFPDVTLVNKPYSGLDLIEALAKSCGRFTPQLVGEAIT